MPPLAFRFTAPNGSIVLSAAAADLEEEEDDDATVGVGFAFDAAACSFESCESMVIAVEEMIGRY